MIISRETFKVSLLKKIQAMMMWVVTPYNDE
jgi:hypothetical protein